MMYRVAGNHFMTCHNICCLCLSRSFDLFALLIAFMFRQQKQAASSQRRSRRRLEKPKQQQLFSSHTHTHTHTQHACLIGFQKFITIERRFAFASQQQQQASV